MSNFIPGIDEEKLRKAAEYLLNPSYGEARVKRFKEVLKDPASNRFFFQKGATPLREVVKLIQCYPHEGSVFMQACDKHRATTVTSEVYAGTKQRREKMAAYMRGLRYRRQLAVQIEEYRRGAPMSTEEANRFASERQKLWDMARKRAVEERPVGEGARAASMRFTEELTARLEKDLAAAKALGPNKVVKASPLLVNALERKFARHAKNSSVDSKFA